MDQCTHCINKGRRGQCDAAPCSIKESWYAQELRTELAWCRDALVRLRNEAQGSVESARECIGNTNAECIMSAIRLADAALEATKPERRERMPEVTFHHASSGHSLGAGGRIEYGAAYFLVKKPEQEGGG